MKKTAAKRVSALVLALLMIMVLAGCGKSSFGITMENEHTCVITAENTEKEMSGSAGSFEVPENATVTIDANIDTEGFIMIQFFNADDVDGSEDLSEFSEDAITESTISGADSMSFDIPAGSYVISATAIDKGITGTVTITVAEK